MDSHVEMKVEYFIGMEVDYVPNRGEPIHTKVTSVGRKWVTTVYGRFDKDTLYMDGGKYSSRGRVWMSKESYEFDKMLERLWVDIRNIVNASYRKPKNLGLGQLEKMLSELRSGNG